MSNRQSSGFLGGLLLGTAIGTVVGILTAPKSGRETRLLVKKSAEALPEIVEDLSTSLQMQADRLSITAFKQWDETLDRLRDAVRAGAEAADAQRQMLLAKDSQKDKLS